MKDALITSAVRTAVGKAPRGTLRDTRPDEMGAAVIKDAMARVPGLDPAEIVESLRGQPGFFQELSGCGLRRPFTRLYVPEH